MDGKKNATIKISQNIGFKISFYLAVVHQETKRHILISICVISFPKCTLVRPRKVNTIKMLNVKLKNKRYQITSFETRK